jgi:CheY-like chemotaxis protein
LTVLIVDDAADTREMYERYFTYRGMRALTAADGVAASQSVVLEQPDVIVIDLAMPRMTGWEVIRRLRAEPMTKGIPIIALSGQNAHDSALEVGADIYLEKPCVPESLLREVVQLVREYRRRRP